jgi:hypothetical protein
MCGSSEFPEGFRFIPTFHQKFQRVSVMNLEGTIGINLVTHLTSHNEY